MKRLTKGIVIPLLLILLLCCRPTAQAYDLRTHEFLNEGAALISRLDTVLRKELNFSDGLQEVIFEERVIDWIGEGGIREDDPVRYLNHFHNPLRSPWRSAGLNDIFFGTSSILWGQDGSQGSAWKNARKAYLKALTAPSRAEREQAFADTFRILGQLMHLIADSSVPAHVRNDQHALPIPGDPYEDWVEEQAKSHTDETSEQARQRFLNTFVPSPERPAGSILELSIVGQDATDAPVPIARLWDTDRYNGTDPLVTLSPQIGISEYANANFFSKHTVFANQFPATDRHFFPFPSSADVEECVDFVNNRKYWCKSKVTPNEPQPLATHLGVVSKRSFWQKTFGAGEEKRGGLDDRVHEVYARLLLPRAVGYSAALLDYFFRNALDVTVSPSSASQNQIELKITNISTEDMEGAFTLYADNFGGVRGEVQGASFKNISLASNASVQLTFTPPSQVLTFVLVFEGRLGSERSAVAGKVIEWYAVTDITPGTIIPGQATTLTITIKSNFTRQAHALTAALFHAKAGKLASTSVIIPNTANTTTTISLDVPSTIITSVGLTPRPISLILASETDINSITAADLNTQPPADTINLIKVGETSRLPVYQRVMTRKLMLVGTPSTFSTAYAGWSFLTTEPYTITWKFKNAQLITVLVQPLNADGDFIHGEIGTSTFSGTETDFSTFTISYTAPAKDTVISLLFIEAQFANTDAFICISDVVNEGRSVLTSPRELGRFTYRECPE